MRRILKLRWGMTKNIHGGTEKDWSQQIITKKQRYEDLETQIVRLTKTEKKEGGGWR